MLQSQLLLENWSESKVPGHKNQMKRVHFIRNQWDFNTNRVKLEYYDRELLEAIEWSPDFVDVIISGQRKCIGYYKDQSYHPCIRSRTVTDFPQCFRCVSHSIPRLRCIFEPACYGDKCPDAICNQFHQVYLAFFNTYPKIGMSSQKRLMLRVLEQGADAYSIVGTVPDRLSARLLEKSIVKILKLRDSYEPEEILKTMPQKIRYDVINEKYELISTSIKDRFELKCSKLIYLDKYPITHPLRSTPKLKRTIGIHKGRFIGIKGKFLFYDSKGLNAVRLDEMLGNYFHIR